MVLFALSAFVALPGNAAETSLSGRGETAQVLTCEFLRKAGEKGEPSQASLAWAAVFLPEEGMDVLHEVLRVARLDTSPEEKGDALIEIAQSSCITFVEIWLIGLILDYLPVFGTLASLLIDIGVLGVLLCLLGLV